MSDLPPQPIRVVADVGGTNTRLALFDPSRNEIRALSTYINREFALLEDIFTHWLDNLGEQPPTACCIAVAAPPSDDQVTMSNMDWSFSCSELATRFGFRQLRRLNDFEANAYALPYLASGDSLELYPGHPVAGGRLATLGPGTGLGGAFLTSLDGSLQSFACEPGHMGLAPGTDLLGLLAGRVGDSLTLVSVGGIWSAHDVAVRLAAGASLVQAYTAFIYEGPLWPRRVVRGLAAPEGARS